MEMNLTLVAFHGSKPYALAQLVHALQAALHSELGPAFSPYAMDQVHATILGLEGHRVGMDAFHTHMLQVFPGSLHMDLCGLLRFAEALPPFLIRIGGFAVAGDYPFTSRGLHPYARSFSMNGSSAVMVGWPVAGDAYPMTLDSMRKACKRYNVLHKYYQKEEDVDNDLFLVLGRVKRESISMQKVESVQDNLRQLLANREPLDLLLRPQDLCVVAYSDPQLPMKSSIRYSLAGAFDRVEELKLLYRESLSLKDE
jgi:hypothetical protein